MLPAIRSSILLVWIALTVVPAASQELPSSPGTVDGALLVKGEARTLTLATTTSRNVRTIVLDGVDDIAAVQVAHSGTKAVVLTASDRLEAFDLTRDTPILRPYATRQIGSSSGTPDRGIGSHSLRSSRFIFVVDGSLVVVDESLTPVTVRAEIAPDLAAAGMRSSTCLLTVSRSGVVVIYDLTSGSLVEEGQIDVAPDDDIDVVTAPSRDSEPCREDTHGGFSVVVHGPRGSSVWSPRRVLPTTATRIEALRQAATALAPSVAFDDDVVTRHCGIGRCRIVLTHLDLDLYLPVLQMAPQETVWPSSVDIWRHLERDKKLDSEFDLKWWPLYQQYARRFASTRECVVYARTVEYPRSWLIQYWLYFPFDLGNRSPHPHDTEHFFVEVDKRGGTLVRLLGDGHGLVSGNNLYSSALDTGYPLTLPSYAFVELGKHATAPDTDKNGFFTPGVDENHYNERSKVWGVRDVIGSINNELLVYDSSMTIPRTRVSRYANANFATLFPGNDDVPAANRTCKVERWQPRVPVKCPDKPEDDLAPDVLEACAVAKIQHHSDFADPNNIFKNELFPAASVRLVLGHAMDGNGWSTAIQLAGEISQTPGIRKLPITGRLSFSASFRRVEDQDPIVEERRLAFALIAGYERFVTNLVGFSLHAGGWDDGILGAALFVEAPLGRSGLNMNFKIGPTVVGGSKTRVGASLSIGAAQRPRHRFR